MPPVTDLPDFRRPDAATVLISPWLVPDARTQRPAADAPAPPAVARYRPHGTVVNVPSPRFR